MQQILQQIKDITLGNPKLGITLANWTFKIPEKFKVIKDQDGLVHLKNANHHFTLSRERLANTCNGQVIQFKDYVLIELFGQKFIFEPFLNIPFLRKLLGMN
jgi:hypothetical protein